MSEAGGGESIFGSEAPSVNPEIVGVDEHAAHPIWQASRRGGGGGGRGGGGRGKGGGGPSTAIVLDDGSGGDGPRYAPLNFKEIEYMARANADGGESSVWTDEEDEEDECIPNNTNTDTTHNGGQRRSRKRARPSGKNTTEQVTDTDRMARAAFGGSLAGDDDDVADSAADSESAAGCQEYRPAIRGEYCIGCTLDRSLVEQVDSFVRRNCGSMADQPLYKASALHYKNEIADKRRREGVRVPEWKWKDIAVHYNYHVTDPVLQRTASVRSLGAMRAVAEQSLLKIMPDGSKMLDAKNAELLLKVVRTPCPACSPLPFERLTRVFCEPCYRFRCRTRTFPRWRRPGCLPRLLAAPPAAATADDRRSDLMIFHIDVLIDAFKM